MNDLNTAANVIPFVVSSDENDQLITVDSSTVVDDYSAALVRFKNVRNPALAADPGVTSTTLVVSAGRRLSHSG